MHTRSIGLKRTISDLLLEDSPKRACRDAAVHEHFEHLLAQLGARPTPARNAVQLEDELARLRVVELELAVSDFDPDVLGSSPGSPRRDRPDTWRSIDRETSALLEPRVTMAYLFPVQCGLARQLEWKA